MSTTDSLFRVNCRHVPAFLLGCIFVTSVIRSSSFVKFFFSRLKRSARSEDETTSEKGQSAVSISASSFNGDNRFLIFLVGFCFASASITLFGSLMTFSPGAGVVCAFLVAWGGIASQSARILGIVILFLELRRLDIRKWETTGLCVWLLVGTILVFVNNALATGVLQPLPEGTALCEPKRSLPISLVSSLMYLLLEIYITLRFRSLLVPPFLKFQHQIASLRDDYRIRRGVALLLFECLILVPGAAHIDIVAEYALFSAGALCILWAFKVHTPFRDASYMISIPPLSREISLHHSIASVNHSVAETSDHLPPLHHHPYSSMSLSDPSMHKPEWPVPQTARSSRTFDTSSVKSIRNAIVQVAKRAVHPFDGEVERYPSPGPADWKAKTRRIIASQDALAEKLELDTKMPPKAIARPRLLLITSPTSDGPESSRSLLPGSAGLFRLTPTFVPVEQSHLSMSSGSQSQRSQSIPSSPSATIPRNSMTTTARTSTISGSSHSSDNHPSSLSRSMTFDGRVSRIRDSRKTFSTLSPPPLPSLEEWPMPPGSLRK